MVGLLFEYNFSRLPYSCFYYFSVPWIVWGGLVVTIALHFARVAPPEEKVVNEILGCHPIESKDELASNSQGNAEQYCMRVVAHRGGGFDYPENSLSAFKNVICLCNNRSACKDPSFIVFNLGTQSLMIKV